MMASFTVRAIGRAAALTLLALPLGLAASQSVAQAKTIAFTITTTVRSGPDLTVEVYAKNTGDETAFAVRPIAEFDGQQSRADSEAKILPGGEHTWTIKVSEAAPGNGAHAMLVRLTYEDANAYPFEVIATAPFYIGENKKRPVSGAFVVPAIPGKTAKNGTLRLAFPEGRGGKYEVRLALPAGVSADKTEFSVTVDDRSPLRLPVEIRNRSLIEDTVVNVFALVSSLDDTAPQTDIIRGNVRIARAEPIINKGMLGAVLLMAAFFLVVLELLSRPTWPWRPHALPAGPYDGAIELALACTVSAALAYNYPWKDAVLAATTVAGGDMGSLYYPTKLMAEEILPRWQLTGWTMGNYAGFAVFHFYSTIPFLLIVLLGKLFPMQQTFKVVTLLGPTFLPLASAYLFRSLGYGRSAAPIAAVSVIPFLFQQGNSMWGGNIPSVLAGEFCHAIGITLSLVYLGVLHQTTIGRRRWPLAAALLALIGLSHSFAFLSAVWYTFFYVWPRAGVSSRFRPVPAILGVTFLLLCFWGLPLPGRLVWTTEWSFIWNIKSWTEVLPEPLWPAAALSAANVVAMLLRFKEYRADRQGVILFNIAGALLLYFLVPLLHFPDIRFIPILQIFVSLLAADMVYWLGGVFRHRLVFATCVVIAGLSYGQSHLGYIPSWLNWNFDGYEKKAPWKLFERINNHIRGDLNDPRVVFEHSQAHNRFGTSRAFENLPLFSGRSTLEGVFHQAAATSPFIFYLQSEASERGSGPFRQHTYTRYNADKALPHLRKFNVSQIVVVSDKAREGYEAHPAFEKTFSSGQYAVFDIEGGDTGYVEVPAFEPVLYDGPEWKLAFYRWWRLPEIFDVPLVPAEMIPEQQAREFSLSTRSILDIEKRPINAQCEIRTHLEQYRISFDTTCPGKPHIVKISYFPRWEAVDGTPIVPVSPAFMLLYPKSEHVEIVYGYRFIDWFSNVISLAGLLLLLACFASPRIADSVESWIAAPFQPIFDFNDRHGTLITLLLVTAFLGTAAYTRVSLQAPDKAYRAAQQAYRDRDFDAAIEQYEAWTQVDRDTFKQATALYQLGVSYAEIDQPAASVDVHERLRWQFPNVNYGPGTLFHLARSYDALGMKDEARERAAALLAEHGESNWVKRLRRERPGLLPEPAPS